MSKKILVLGDSVPWGQGLNDPQKFHNLVAATMNFAAADVVLTAHSGAVIGASIKKIRPAVHGEVPVSYPTILQQCRNFTGNNGDVELVIVNGGINDVDFRFIINPLTDPEDLHDAIVRHCYADIKVLLTEVAVRFPNPTARIVLTSYYPILSKYSNLLLVPAFLLLHGIVIPPFVLPAKDLAFGRLVANCQQFWAESNASFEKAVNETNASLGGAPRILFAEIPFEDENATFAPKAWLWGINPDLSAEDPVCADRHTACDIHEKDLIQRQICYRASAGHPNILGAEQFAKAICAILESV